MQLSVRRMLSCSLMYTFLDHFQSSVWTMNTWYESYIKFAQQSWYMNMKNNTWGILSVNIHTYSLNDYHRPHYLWECNHYQRWFSKQHFKHCSIQRIHLEVNRIELRSTEVRVKPDFTSCYPPSLRWLRNARLHETAADLVLQQGGGGWIIYKLFPFHLLRSISLSLARALALAFSLRPSCEPLRWGNGGAIPSA